MKKIFQLSILALSVQIGACSWFDSDDTKSSDLVTKYDGVWLAEAYGQGMKIDKGHIQLFDYTTDYCLLEDDDYIDSESEIDAFVEYVDDEHFTLIEGAGTAEFHSPGVEFTKTSNGLMPVSCENGFIPQKGQTDYQRDVERDLDIFFQTFEEYYISFDLTNTDWNSVYDITSAQVDNDTSDQELFEVFYNVISELKDAHVEVESPEFGVASVNNEPVFWEQLLQEFAELNNLSLPIASEHANDANNYITENIELYNAIIDSYAEDEDDIKSYGNGALKWFAVDGVGYLEISTMIDIIGNGEVDDIEGNLDAAEAAIEEALTDLSETDALILDVRMNNGGRDVISMKFPV